MLAAAENRIRLLEMRMQDGERMLTGMRESLQFKQAVEQQRIDGELLKENGWFAGAATIGRGGAL